MSHANENYRNDDGSQLDNKEFIAQCYLKAVSMLLNIEGLEYPKRNVTESIDE